ncbi:MAG: hypothetical protein QMD92_00035 [bacterium]|nr:hypothetical protein [bacterium]
MKVILEFNLPEEESELGQAINGSKYATILYDIDQEIRNYLEYGHKFTSVIEALEAVRALIHDELRERNLSIYV